MVQGDMSNARRVLYLFPPSASLYNRGSREWLRGLVTGLGWLGDRSSGCPRTGGEDRMAGRGKVGPADRGEGKGPVARLWRKLPTGGSARWVEFVRLVCGPRARQRPQWAPWRLRAADVTHRC